MPAHSRARAGARTAEGAAGATVGTATWSHIQRGTLSGIDWSASQALDGVDPYLVWADATANAAVNAATDAETSTACAIPLLMELAPGVSASHLLHAAGPQQLWIPPVYLGDALPAGFRYCTALATPALVQAIHGSGALRALVSRAEVALAAAGTVPAATAHETGAPREGLPQLRLGGTVAGFIDDGFAVAHHAFIDAQGQPRVAALWRQDPNLAHTAHTANTASSASPHTPADLAYGSEIRAAHIHAARMAHRHGGLVDEDAVYRALGLGTLHQRCARASSTLHALDLNASHGTQVMGLGSAGHHHPLLAVQLDAATVADTSGGALSVRLLDAIAWMVARCAPDAALGINISFGALAGAHDGSSVLEYAIDQLLALRPHTQVFIAAGNAYQARMHANGVLAPRGAGGAQTLHWRVPPDDATPSFLELWLPPDAHAVSVTLQPPGRWPAATVRAGQALQLTDAQGRTLCAMVQPLRSATSIGSRCVLLALMPTAHGPHARPASKAHSAVAPHGVWKITLTNHGRRAVAFDAWIERDDALPGTRSGARASRFEDDPALPLRHRYDPDALHDDPARATPIRRSGSFNSLATGRRSVAVGGVRAHWQHPASANAPYSAPLMDPDPQRVRRPDVRRNPGTVAITDESPVQGGVAAIGPRSGGMTRLSGTSAAAPQALNRWLLGQSRG